MSEQEGSASQSREIPAFSRPQSVPPLRVKSKEARRSATMSESPTRSALARQGSMSRLHGPRQAGSPARTRKSVSFDYRDEVIQYEAPTPEPRFTPEPTFAEFTADLHPLPSLPQDSPSFDPEMGPVAALQSNNPTENADSPSLDHQSHVTLGWDDELPSPASPNPLMAELDQSRPKLSRRVDAVMEEAPELAKKPFVRTHRAHASWGSQSSLLREGLHAVPNSPLPEASEEEASDEESHHLERLPSLIRQESLLETQRRPPTVRMSDKEIPAPSEVQRSYSQRRKTLLKMLDSNKPDVPEMIAEEEEEVRYEISASRSTYDLFAGESMAVGIDPGSPSRESPREVLASMSPKRQSLVADGVAPTTFFGTATERPLPKLPSPKPLEVEFTSPKPSETLIETPSETPSEIQSETPNETPSETRPEVLPVTEVKHEAQHRELSEKQLITEPTVEPDQAASPKLDFTAPSVELETPKQTSESEFLVADRDSSVSSSEHVDVSFEKPRIVSIGRQASMSVPTVEVPDSPEEEAHEVFSPEVTLESYHGTPMLSGPAAMLRTESVVRRLELVQEADVESNGSAETSDGSVGETVTAEAKETSEATQAYVQTVPFAPLVTIDTPDLGTFNSSPFAVSVPGTPFEFSAFVPSQAEAERRQFVERQAELIREANGRAEEVAEPAELVEEPAEPAEPVEPVETEESPQLVEKQQTASPVLELPRLDSDLSDSDMSSPEAELQPAVEIGEAIIVPSPAIGRFDSASDGWAPPISSSTLSVETGDSLQNMSSEFEQLLTPRRGYTVRESPNYVMASSPARQRSTPVRRNGALEIGAGPRLPQAASTGQISTVSPRRLVQSASASPVRVPEHRRGRPPARPVWTAPPVQEEPAEEPKAVVPEVVVADSPTTVTPPSVRDRTPPLAPTSVPPTPTPRGESEIKIPRVRPSREALGNDYRQLPPEVPVPEVPTAVPAAVPATPQRVPTLLHSSPGVRKSRPRAKFAGRLATSPTESGRLFVRVDSVTPGLPDAAEHQAAVWLELDNGEHCLTTPEAAVVGDRAAFGKEYELVVAAEQAAVVTAHIRWSASPPPSAGLLGRLRRRSHPDADWQQLVAADGAFGRCTLAFGDLAEQALGRATPVTVRLHNEWFDRSGGELRLTALFVPRMSAKEALPATMADAQKQIAAAQRESRARKDGVLVVNGKRRFCIVDDANLVVYTAETRKPRASFTLAKATACAAAREIVRLEFCTGDVLRLESESAAAATEWSDALNATIARPARRSPWLNLILYR